MTMTFLRGGELNIKRYPLKNYEPVSRLIPPAENKIHQGTAWLWRACMIRLRPYKKSDASYLLQWITGEAEFIKWCAGQFTYPLTSSQLEQYRQKMEADDFAWPMVAVDQAGSPVGHILMRNADYRRDSLHFGFIIVDPKERGKGYGKALVAGALRYAFDLLHMRRVTLNVFANNPAAHSCYLAVGFHDEGFDPAYLEFQGEPWGRYDMAAEQ